MTDHQQTTLDDLLAPTPGPGGETEAILAQARTLFARLDALPETERINTVNLLRLALREHSPLKDQPVDCVIWVEADEVAGNEYNPNHVADPEMELLGLSIRQDGYTQPIVAWPVEGTGGSRYEVVDGFHRHLVGKTDPEVKTSVRGRLPVTIIGSDRTGKPDRMAATIRHNRARGEHAPAKMADIVIELARLRRSDEWIGEHLGMDPDEVTRLRTITGIAEQFKDRAYSQAWEADTSAPDPEFGRKDTAP
ncbi:IbrB-like domain-containing protein [Streptomyces bacillaris]|uniref:IbrB-like domain-containing protein n=1 Tax=Streptomyces bacillaris TaxID=68179 RepID=UPI003460B9C2